MSLPIHLMSNFPSVRPSLNLQFDSQPTPADMTSHLASVGATFSRASIGTYTDANGLIQEASAGQARPNYSTAGVHEGLLIEESRTNLIKSSEDFSTTDWDLLSNGTGSNPVVTINQEIAPDGTASADKIVFDAGAGTTSSDSSQVNQSVSFPNNTDGTASIWLKGESGGEQITLRGVGGSTYQLLTLTTEWQRFTTTEDSVTTNDAILFGIRQNVSGHGVINSTATVYAWGAQVEEGSFPTSYIPTIPTFSSRASTATYFDSSGELKTASIDEARTNHKYIDGEWVEAGLLLEGASTNLLTYSNNFTTGWSLANITVSNQTITNPTPDATIGKLLSDSISSTEHRIRKSLSLSTDTTYTASVIVKDIDVRYFYIRDLTNNYWTVYDTVDGDVYKSNANIKATMEDLGNGFWYITATFTTPSTITNNFIDFGITISSTSFVSTVPIGDGGYMGAFQLEEGSQPTSYIPTSGSTVTRSADVYTTATKVRSADVCQITGTNFTDFYNEDEGTVLVEVASNYVESNSFSHALYQFGGGITHINYRQNLFRSSGRLIIGTTDTSITYSSTSKEFDKFSISMTDPINYAVNGTVSSDITTQDISGHTSLYIGVLSGGSNSLNGTIKKFIYFPRALTNQIQKLTQ